MNFNKIIWNAFDSTGYQVIDGQLKLTKYRYQVLDATVRPANPLPNHLPDINAKLTAALAAKRTTEKYPFQPGYGSDNNHLIVSGSGATRDIEQFTVPIFYNGKIVLEVLAVDVCEHIEAGEHALVAYAETLVAQIRSQNAEMFAKEKEG